MKTYRQRINNIIGQLKGVSKMMDEEKEFSNVVVQIKAARFALDSILQKYSQEKLTKCLKLDTNQKELCNNFIKEIIKTI